MLQHRAVSEATHTKTAELYWSVIFLLTETYPMKNKTTNKCLHILTKYIRCKTYHKSSILTTETRHSYSIHDMMKHSSEICCQNDKYSSLPFPRLTLNQKKKYSLKLLVVSWNNYNLSELANRLILASY